MTESGDRLTKSASKAVTMADLQRENTYLRAALAHSDHPCVYCTRTKEEWNTCPFGFPGCPRGDDAMGCPELGARMALDELTKLVQDYIGRYEEGAPDQIPLFVQLKKAVLQPVANENG